MSASTPPGRCRPANRPSPGTSWNTASIPPGMTGARPPRTRLRTRAARRRRSAHPAPVPPGPNPATAPFWPICTTTPCTGCACGPPAAKAPGPGPTGLRRFPGRRPPRWPRTAGPWPTTPIRPGRRCDPLVGAGRHACGLVRFLGRRLALPGGARLRARSPQLRGHGVGHGWNGPTDYPVTVSVTDVAEPPPPRRPT